MRGPADPEQVRRAVFAALSRLTSAMQRQSPVLVVVEDAHWIDPSTTEHVGQMLTDMASQRLFVLLTARPEFRAPWSNSSPDGDLAARQAQPPRDRSDDTWRRAR